MNFVLVYRFHHHYQTLPPPWCCRHRCRFSDQSKLNRPKNMSTVNLNPRKSPNMLTKQGSNQWVRLNVGGSIFLTTKTTLSRDPNSFLARLIQDSDLISDKVSCVCVCAFFSIYLSIASLCILYVLHIQ